MEYLHELAVLTYWQLFIIHLNDHEVKSRIMLSVPLPAHMCLQKFLLILYCSHRAKAGLSAAHVSTLNRLEL